MAKKTTTTKTATDPITPVKKPNQFQVVDKQGKYPVTGYDTPYSGSELEVYQFLMKKHYCINYGLPIERVTIQ